MAMRMTNIKMTTTVSRSWLLKKVTENYQRHKVVVREAKAGYLLKSIAALQKRLDLLQNGEQVDLTFNLHRPQDFSEVYENTIEMLNVNTVEEVTLEADEFRQLVRDQWDWADDFYLRNTAYSATAGALLKK